MQAGETSGDCRRGKKRTEEATDVDVDNLSQLSPSHGLTSAACLLLAHDQSRGIKRPRPSYIGGSNSRTNKEASRRSATLMVVRIRGCGEAGRDK